MNIEEMSTSNKDENTAYGLHPIFICAFLTAGDTSDTVGQKGDMPRGKATHTQADTLNYRHFAMTYTCMKTQAQSGRPTWRQLSWLTLNLHPHLHSILV